MMFVSILGYCQQNNTKLSKDLNYFKSTYKKGNRDIEFIKEYIKFLENKVKKPKLGKFSFSFSKYRNPESKKLVLDYLSKCPIRQLSEKYIWDLGGEYLLKDVYSNAFEFYQSRLNKFKWGKQDARFSIMKAIDMAVDKEIKKLAYPKLTKDGNYILPKYNAEKINYLVNQFINKEILSSAEQKVVIKLYKLLQSKEYKKAFDSIEFAINLDIIRSNRDYINCFLGFIICQSKDNEMLKKAVKWLNYYAIEEAKGGSIGFNFYDNISNAYKKLGEIEKANEAKQKSIKMEQKRSERFGDFMKILKQQKK